MKAIELLTRTGREGPCDGQRLAVVARRAMELEHGSVALDMESTSVNSSAEVAEDLRIHGIIVPEISRLHSVDIDVYLHLHLRFFPKAGVMFRLD